MTVAIRVLWNDEELLNETFDGGQTWIGSSPDCDLVIDHEAVAGFHALLERRAGGHYVLLDLDTDEGIRRGTRRLPRWNLNSGDALTIGNLTLTFTLGPAANGEEGAETNQRTIWELSSPRVGSLQSVATDETTKVERDVFTIGSSPDADLRIEGSPPAPTWAALIVRGPDGFSVHNVAPSAEGLKLNGDPLADRGSLDLDAVLEIRGRAFLFADDSPVEFERPTAREAAPDTPAPPSKPAKTKTPDGDWTQRKTKKSRPTARTSRKKTKRQKQDTQEAKANKDKNKQEGKKLPPWLRVIILVVWILLLGAFFGKTFMSVLQVFT